MPVTFARLLTSAKRECFTLIPPRFEIFLDPLNNWTVWDNQEDDFAEVGTRYLFSLPEREATAFCFLLNMLLDSLPPSSDNHSGEPGLLSNS